MFLVIRSLTFRWFKNSLLYLIESSCYTFLVVARKILLRKPGIGTIADDSSETTWNGLPDVAIKKIFGELKVEDRARMKLVSKSWNKILNRVDIPTSPHEAPWLIMSDDSYSKPGICLDHIVMGTVNNVVEHGIADYQFKLPNFYENVDDDDGVPARGCLCGTSDGWLMIASTAGGANLNNNNKPDMFLWNPLSGAIRKLPPLSTLPFVTPIKPDDLPSVVKRVEIFSQEECRVVVSVVFSHSTTGEEDCLALCTPYEKRWSVLTKRNCYYSYRYRDILHHNGKLYALAQNINNDDSIDEEEEKVLKENQDIHLSWRSNYCEVKVCVLRLKYKLNAQRRTRFSEDGEFINRSFNVTYANEFCEHLVACSATGKLLVVAAVFDLYKYNMNGGGPVESFTCHKTSSFEVRMVETLERVSTIGEQSFYIASTGSMSILSSSAPGYRNYILFSTDDAQGLVGDQHQYRIAARELGHCNMQRNVARSHPRYLRFPVHSKTGWFRPKLF